MVLFLKEICHKKRWIEQCWIRCFPMSNFEIYIKLSTLITHLLYQTSECICYNVHFEIFILLRRLSLLYKVAGVSEMKRSVLALMKYLDENMDCVSRIQAKHPWHNESRLDEINCHSDEIERDQILVWKCPIQVYLMEKDTKVKCRKLFLDNYPSKTFEMCC